MASDPIEWPPDVDDVKADLKIKPADARDDVALGRALDAAIAFVQRVHRGRYTFTGVPTAARPAPDDTLALGVVRLAARWHARRSSPDGLVALGELGASRVSSYDPDVDRLCRIGRYAPPVIA